MKNRLEVARALIGHANGTGSSEPTTTTAAATWHKARGEKCRRVAIDRAASRNVDDGDACRNKTETYPLQKGVLKDIISLEGVTVMWCRVAL